MLKKNSNQKNSDCESEEESNSNEEREDEFYEGGHHIVQNEDALSQRYRALYKMGWGNFSTVWLSEDHKTGKFVAIKIVKSKPSYMEAALDELKILKQIQTHDKNSVGYNKIVHILSDFYITGLNGKHICMVFEVLGFNLLKMLKYTDFKGLPIPVVKIISRDIFEGLSFLHDVCKIIHTDLKPENVMASIDERSIINLAHRYHRMKNCKTLLPKAMTCNVSKSRVEKHLEWMKNHNGDVNIDKFHENFKYHSNENSSNLFSNSTSSIAENNDADHHFEDQNNWIHLTYKIVDLGNAIETNTVIDYDIQTRQYRSIEVLLGIPFCETTDIWSTSCMIFELFTGDYLFNPKSSDNGSFNRDEDHIARIIELIGDIPSRFLSTGKYYKKYFRQGSHLKHVSKLNYCSLEKLLITDYNVEKGIAKELSKFLLPMLHYDPNKRQSAKDCLKHQFLHDL